MILMNALVGLPMMLLCLIIQVLFAYGGVRHCVRYLRNHAGPITLSTGVRPLLIAMLIMMLGTLVQLVVWGVLFLWLGEFDELYEAIYHSAVNFASLGYGDIVMSRPWKMLGALEAINGVLMLGMSAAALMAILQQLIHSEYERVKSEMPG